MTRPPYSEQLSPHEPIYTHEVPDLLELGPDEVSQVDTSRVFLLTGGTGMLPELPNWQPPEALGSAVHIRGREVLRLYSGQDPTLPYIGIINVRGNRVHDFRSDVGPIYDLGRIGFNPVYRPGELALLMYSNDMQAAEVHSLNEGAEPLVIGRGMSESGRPYVGSLTPGLLPGTMSREHCAVSLDRQGVLTVESRNPTNPLSLGRPASELRDLAKERVAADRLEHILQNIPEGADRRVLLHNLALMYGSGSSMQNLLNEESIGGNGGRERIGSVWYSCGGANGYYDVESGQVTAFGNVQDLPPSLVDRHSEFTMRVAQDRIYIKDSRILNTGNFRGFFRILSLNGDNGQSVEVPSVEHARNMLELSAAAYNELMA